jgi:hypothetical protein
MRREEEERKEPNPGTVVFIASHGEELIENNIVNID